MTAVNTAFPQNTNTPFTLGELNSYGKLLSAMGLTHDNDAFPALMRTAALPIMLAGRDATLQVKDIAPSTAYVVPANSIFIGLHLEHPGTVINSVNNGTTTFNLTYNAATGARTVRTCLVLQTGDTFTTGATSYGLGLLISSTIQSDITRVLQKVSSTATYIVPDDKIFILTHASVADQTTANAYDCLVIDGTMGPPIGAVLSSSNARIVFARPFPFNEGQQLSAITPTGSGGILISGFLFDKNTSTSTAIFSSLENGDLPTVNEWNALGKALQAITSPSPDDNNGSPVFGRSIGLPFAFDWTDPNFKAVAVGTGQTFEVQEGTIFVVLMIGHENGSNTTTITPSGGSAFTISNASSSASPCMIILPEGTKLANSIVSTASGCAMGFIMSVPSGMTPVLTTITSAAPYTVDPGKMLYCTSITGDNTATLPQWRIDGAIGAIHPSLGAAASCFISMYDQWFVLPLNQYQSISPVSTSITGLISGVLIDRAPATTTTLPTSITNFATITKAQINSWGKALDAIGITKDNGAKMMAARGCLPVELMSVDNLVSSRGISSYTLTVPTGMLLIITGISATTTSAPVATTITPSGSGAINIYPSGLPASTHVHRILLFLAAGDTISSSVSTSFTGFLISAPSGFTRIMRTVTSGSTYTVGASKIGLITCAFAQSGGAAARLTIGGAANLSVPLLSSATAAALVSMLPFKAAQVVGGDHATNAIVISGLEFNAN